MLGFDLIFFRHSRATVEPSVFDEQLYSKEYGERLVNWETSGFDGSVMDTIDDMVERDLARALLIQGYPTLYVSEPYETIRAITENRLARAHDETELALVATKTKWGPWDQRLLPTRNKVLSGWPILNCNTELGSNARLDWIEALVDRGDARQVEDGDRKVYRGDREALITGLIEDQLGPCRRDEAIVLTAWDLS